jgi:hypothetical protein
MELPWTLWLLTAVAGMLLGGLRRPSAAGWQLDALLLFLLASLVCDSLAAFAADDGWRLNPYAISAGFALAALLRAKLREAPRPGDTIQPLR